MAPDSDPLNQRSICTILGGANGSGKSSVYETLAPVGRFVNADAAAKLISPEHPENVTLAAGRQVLRELDTLLGARASFTYETTLSGRQPLDVMRRAKAAGYEVGLIFVVLASVDLNVDRVAQRVARGGHDIPEAVIRRRYAKSLTNLGKALLLADETIVLENTKLDPSVLLRIRSNVIEADCLQPDDPVHSRIAQILADLPIDRRRSS